MAHTMRGNGNDLHRKTVRTNEEDETNEGIPSVHNDQWANGNAITAAQIDCPHTLRQEEILI